MYDAASYVAPIASSTSHPALNAELYRRCYYDDLPLLDDERCDAQREAWFGEGVYNRMTSTSPRLAVSCDQLAYPGYFFKIACCPPKHERAVKQHLYISTLGLAHTRGAAARKRIFQVLQSVAVKRKIWRYLDFAKLVDLAVEIVTPAMSEYDSIFTTINMLAGEKVWGTKSMPAHQVESVVLDVAAGSRVTSFDVASVGSRSDCEMCVEEVAADGTVGATLLAWNKYGTCSGDYNMPSSYTPATIAVETMATRFKVSVLHTYVSGYRCAGVAIFRATGVAP